MLLANLAFATVATLAGSSAVVGDGTDHRRDLAAAPKARCQIHQVHTPAGKFAPGTPIVRCDRPARTALVAPASASADAKSR